ncbi:MAG: 50S ribosomal protein L11 methyltransferase [Succinivibrio sp.]|nr:50S ribosomal protein L11 methyltransferase [Succinivibrio sp.]
MDNNTDWIQIKVVTDNETAAKVTEFLEKTGALAVTYQDTQDDAIYEPEVGQMRLWPNTEVTGLYEQGFNADPVVEQLRREFGFMTPIAKVRLEDKNWIRAWMDQFKPMKFGRHLWVCPTWLEVTEPDAAVIKLDPGLAFGTGTHPTTAMCLEWLDSLKLDDKRVLDFGCGSGILGIAALKLGAMSVYGVDVDDQAMIASEENAERNGVKGQLQLKLGGPDLKLEPFDICVANILTGPLIFLEPQIATLTKQGGRLALSGILTEQAEEIMQCYEKDFIVEKSADRAGWAIVTGVRR